MEPFWNRNNELNQIKQQLNKYGFGFVTGRRRVGKTALLRKVCDDFGGIYHQAVEGTPAQQLLHLCEEIGDRLTLFKDVIPKTWNEFFRLLPREKLPPLIVFDEFPYWVAADSTLPSFFQKWIDHELPKQKTLCLVSGSSQSMLYSEMLKPSSPLYGRASLHLHLKPMGYDWFCKALDYDAGDPVSFERYSLVGGVPHYWKLMSKTPLLEQVQSLYFEPNAILSEEPIYLLRDEGIVGLLPKAILDFVGRGVSKPSELAARLGTVQGNLSRPLSVLLELGLLYRELPFGETSRTTKKVLYSILDPSLAFYYGIYLPFKSRWENMDVKEKENLISQHASRQWEHFCRLKLKGAARYWERDIELDLVVEREKKKYLVAECKWSDVSPNEEKRLLAELREKFVKTGLGKKFKTVDFKIYSKKDLVHFADDSFV